MNKNLSPCFISPPPNGGDAFSLVRKVQGQPSGTGEASKARELTAEILPEDTTPASPTRQKNNYGMNRLGRATFFEKIPGDNKKIEARKTKIKREIVKEVSERIYKKMYAGDIATQYDWDAFDEKIVQFGARLAINLWEKRR